MDTNWKPGKPPNLPPSETDSYLPPSEREWFARLVHGLEGRINVKFELVNQRLDCHDNDLRTLMGKQTRYTGAAVIIGGVIFEVLRRLGVV